MKKVKEAVPFDRLKIKTLRRKLEKQVTENSVTTTTDYVGPMVYEGTNDMFLNTEEGRVVLKEGGTAKEEYQYNLRMRFGKRPPGQCSGDLYDRFIPADDQHLPGHDGAAGKQPEKTRRSATWKPPGKQTRSTTTRRAGTAVRD